MAEKRGHGREHAQPRQLQQERDLLAPRFLHTRLSQLSLSLCDQGIKRIFQQKILLDAQLLCRGKRERETPGAIFSRKGTPFWSAQIVTLEHSL